MLRLPATLRRLRRSFHDIFKQISQRVDLLEYANSGSATMLSREDAKIISEDIGADARELDAFI